MSSAGTISPDEALRRIEQNVIGSTPKITMPASKQKGRVGPGSLVVKKLCDIPSEKINWLWQGRIALGKLNLIGGRKGEGKSMCTLAIASALTRGERLPGDLRPPPPSPADVLFLTFEDGHGDTMRPRLERMGADIARAHVITGALDADGQTAAFSAEYIPKVEKVLQEHPAIQMVVIDPLMAVLGGIDAHRDNEVRTVLQPLVEIAQRRKVAVVIVAHVNKPKYDDPLAAIAGSVGIVNICRSILFVGGDPHDEQRHAIVKLEGNLTGTNSPIAFHITSDEHDANIPVFTWDGSDDTLDAWTMNTTHNKKPSKLDDAKEFLRTTLANGPKIKNVVYFEASQKGISSRTIDRAKADLHIVTEKGFGGAATWALPS